MLVASLSLDKSKRRFRAMCPSCTYVVWILAVGGHWLVMSVVNNLPQWTWKLRRWRGMWQSCTYPIFRGHCFDGIILVVRSNVGGRTWALLTLMQFGIWRFCLVGSFLIWGSWVDECSSNFGGSAVNVRSLLFFVWGGGKADLTESTSLARTYALFARTPFKFRRFAVSVKSVLSLSPR